MIEVVGPNGEGQSTSRAALWVIVAASAVLMLAVLSHVGALGLARVLQGLPLVLPDNAEPEDEPEDVPKILRGAYQLRRLGDVSSAEARQQLEDLASREDAVGYLASVRLARQLPDSRSEDTERYYRRALDLLRTDEIQWELAQFVQKMGRDGEALELYLQLLPDDRIYREVAKLDLPAEVLGEGLLKEELFSEAAGLLEPEVQQQPQSQVAGLYGRALAGLGEYEEALPYLHARWQAEPADLEAGWWFARCLEITQDVDKALEVYRQLGPRGKQRRAALAESRGDLHSAAGLYAGAPEASARWRGAQLLQIIGRTDEALTVYRQIMGQSGSLQDDAAFRLYVLLTERDDDSAADVLSEIEDIPAWMDRLGRQPVWPEMKEVGRLEEPRFFARYAAYLEAGYEEPAELELKIGSALADDRQHIFLGRWYLRQDDFAAAARHGLRALAGGSYLEAYQLAYPLPYETEVIQAADDYALHPQLLWAVMHQESFFRHLAVSPAGAIGLMQIMPATGAQIAAEKGMEFSTQALFDPQISIRFGAYYLRMMLDMFEGDLDQALAAYNAGPGNARRWVDSPLSDSPHGFVAAITFSETRRYVTLVRNAYLTYCRLDATR